VAPLRVPVSVFFVLSLLVPGLVSGVPTLVESPPMAAQEEPGEPRPGELQAPDGADDVTVQPGGPAGAYGDLADAVDIRNVRLYGETGELLRITLTVADLKQEPNWPSTVSQGIDYWVCFKIDGVQYAVWLWLLYASKPVEAGRSLGTVTGDCSATGATWQKQNAGVNVYLDLVESQILFVIKRQSLGFLAANAQPPTLGATVTGLYAVARDHRNMGGARFDAAPNGGPASDSMSLVYPTANLHLKMRPDVNVPFPLPCGQNRDLPTVAIEAGGKRGIPMTVSNFLDAPRQVKFSVRAIEGPGWNAKMMPGIEIPAATDASLGNLTVNVIVDTPASTKHKECTTLLVRAVDAADATAVGEAAVNVVAAVPPTAQRNRFYLHSNALATNACSGTNIWMNTQQDDAASVNQPVAFVYCEGLTQLSLDPTSLLFVWDVNPSFDLIVNSTVTGKAVDVVLRLVSDHVETKARITPNLVSLHPTGTEIFGSTSQVVQIGTSPKEFTFRIPIGFTREYVAEGDPSRVIDATGRMGIAVRYEVIPAEPNVPEVKQAGKVWLLPQGSHATLPIWSTVKRTANEPGLSGALISLKALQPVEGFANPGKMRAFNFTVLNEGATDDVAVVTARVVDGNMAWEAQVVPSGPFRLAAGESKRFAVGILPPVEARESEGVRVEVVAMSQSDATARSSTTLRVIATHGQDLGGSTLDVPVAPTKKGGLPSIGALAVMALALLAVLAIRRRP
jgi:hypothetical protein